MKAYCFVPEEQIEEIKECGMDLSLGKHYACKVTTNGGMCFMGRLNPRDYSQQDFEPGTVLVKINLAKVRCFIGESEFFQCDEDEDIKFSMFEDSLVPSGEYKLGTYRSPLCLIVNAVLPDAVESYDRLMDEIIPYENSSALYVDCLFNDACDEGENFKELALTAYYEKMALEGKMKKLSYENYNIFKKDDISYVLKKG